MRSSAEGVANADVTELVDRWTRHPTIELIRRIGSLLKERGIAVPVDSKLVPPYAACARGSVDGMDGNDHFTVTDPPIHKPGHDLVALCVKPAFDSRLRHAIGE